MFKKILATNMLLFLCLCLATNVMAQAESGPIAPQNVSAGLKDQDLLMFFEEQDLVTATKRSTSLRKAPAIATIINADEIRDMGARSLMDVLKMVPSIGISINEPGLHMVEVRGVRSFLSEKILVMIDGHSLNKNFTGSAIFDYAEMMSVENIKQVEVIRGPGSALYGNSAFVATINIITRNAEEIDGVEIKAGGGSFNSFKGNLIGGYAGGEKLTASGSLDHYQTRGAKLKIEADTLTGTPFSSAPGTADLTYKQTDAFLKVGYGDLSFRGGYKKVRQGGYAGIVSALADDSFADHDTYWGEMAYSRHLTDNLSVNLKLYYDHYEQNPNVKIFPNGFAGVFPGGMIGKPLVKDRTFGGEIQIDQDVFEGNHLSAGVSFEEMQQYDTKQLANFDPLSGAPLGSVQEVSNWNKNVTRQIWAVYLQDEWQLLKNVNLTTGVRYDHYSDFGDTINPRLGLVWSFLENADLKLLYGQAFRAPNFQELYNINNSTVVGNPDLKPERISTFEAGLSWYLNRYLTTSLNYFYSEIKDQIGWVPSSTPGTPAINANLNKTEIHGIELGLGGAYGPDLYWKANYTWQDPRDVATGRLMPHVPSHRANGSINYVFNKYLNLHTDVLWTGPRPREKSDTRPETPSYTTVDVAATLKNFLKNFEIQATIHNLFDQHYTDPDTSSGLVNLSGTGPKIPGDFPREGISGFVTASYYF